MQLDTAVGRARTSTFVMHITPLARRHRATLCILSAHEMKFIVLPFAPDLVSEIEAAAWKDRDADHVKILNRGIVIGRIFCAVTVPSGCFMYELYSNWWAENTLADVHRHVKR